MTKAHLLSALVAEHAGERTNDHKNKIRWEFLVDTEIEVNLIDNEIKGIRCTMGQGMDILVHIENIQWRCNDLYLDSMVDFFHATAAENLKGILHQGLKFGTRQYSMRSGYPHGDPRAEKMQKSNSDAYIVIEFNNIA